MAGGWSFLVTEGLIRPVRAGRGERRLGQRGPEPAGSFARFEQDLAISCDTTDNALHTRYRETAFSFYSAREGLERPSVYGSRTKRRVVDESQMTLDVGDEIELRRLVLMHEAADDGLVRLGVGVLASSTEWSWNVRLYDRYASDEGAEVDDQRVAYDQLPEPELPELAPRQRERSDHAAK